MDFLLFFECFNLGWKIHQKINSRWTSYTAQPSSPKERSLFTIPLKEMQLFATISLATIVAEHIYFRYKSLWNIGTIIIIYDNLYCTLETIFLLELWQNRNSFSARDSKFGDCRIMKKSSAAPRISFPSRESNKVFYLMRKLFQEVTLIWDHSKENVNLWMIVKSFKMHL